MAMLQPDDVFFTAPTDTLSCVDTACPGCGHVEPRHIARGIPLSQAPWLREAILGGRLHTFVCAACETGFRVESIFSYLDVRRQTWMCVLPDAAHADLPGALRLAESTFTQTMVAEGPSMVRDWGRQAVRRVVFGLASLREKLIAFEHGLDDRLLEGTKLAVMRALGLQPEQPLFLDRVTPEALIFMRRGEAPIELPVPLAMYHAAEPLGQPGDWAIDCRIGTLLSPTMPAPPAVRA